VIELISTDDETGWIYFRILDDNMKGEVYTSEDSEPE
jgi:hypothetical protein